MGEPGGLLSMGSHRVGHDWSDLAAAAPILHTGLPRWHSGKESTCQCRRLESRGFDPWIGKIPWRRKWQAALVFLPGESNGQRSLVGYSPWGHGVGPHSVHTQHQLYGYTTFYASLTKFDFNFIKRWSCWVYSFGIYFCFLSIILLRLFLLFV